MNAPWRRPLCAYIMSVDDHGDVNIETWEYQPGKLMFYKKSPPIPVPANEDDDWLVLEEIIAGEK